MWRQSLMRLQMLGGSLSGSRRNRLEGEHDLP
jgi:hypothetical protein